MTVTLGSDTASGREIGSVSQREHAQGSRRHQQILEYGVLDRPPAADLVSLAELAAQICGTPVSAISLITETQAHHLATVGFEPSTRARTESSYDRVFSQREPVIVWDMSQDPRFADDPFVNGEIARLCFFASCRLVTTEGLPVGMLSVADHEPRTLSPQQHRALTMLAARVMDVLELRLRTRQLESSLEAVNRSNEQLAVFAGQVSHDLRSPLTGVLGYAKMLTNRPSILQDEEAAWLLDRAIGSAERMGVLIEELLEYAGVGGGLGRKNVQLARLANEVVEDLGPQLCESGVEVVVAELPTVSGDEAQLRALLLNLVANSMKFTRPGISPRITISGRRVRDHWHIEVADNGIGVPEEQRSTVFDLLARGGHDSVAGSGIGLATCKRIVEAHGGQIGLQPSVDGGTLVWFALPDSA